MQIVFKREVADKLRERYTVLELETFDVKGELIETFCVIPAEKIALSEAPELESNISLHQDYITALTSKNYDKCIQLYPLLINKFGGELNSFYEIINERLTKDLV